MASAASERRKRFSLAAVEVEAVPVDELSKKTVDSRLVNSPGLSPDLKMVITLLRGRLSAAAVLVAVAARAAVGVTAALSNRFLAGKTILGDAEDDVTASNTSSISRLASSSSERSSMLILASNCSLRASCCCRSSSSCRCLVSRASCWAFSRASCCCLMMRACCCCCWSPSKLAPRRAGSREAICELRPGTAAVATIAGRPPKASGAAATVLTMVSVLYSVAVTTLVELSTMVVVIGRPRRVMGNTVDFSSESVVT